MPGFRAERVWKGDMVPFDGVLMSDMLFLDMVERTAICVEQESVNQ